MSIYAIVLEEMFNLRCNLFCSQLFLYPADPLEHRYRPELIYFSDVSKEFKVCVCDTHVLFIVLSDLTSLERCKLCCRHSIQYFIDELNSMFTIPSEVVVQSILREGTDRVNVPGAAIVFG